MTRQKQKRMLSTWQRRGSQLLKTSGTRSSMPSFGRRKGKKGQETNDPPIRLHMFPNLLSKMDRGRKITLHVGKPRR